jgi:hypothetical protein
LKENKVFGERALENDDKRWVSLILNYDLEEPLLNRIWNVYASF